LGFCGRAGLEPHPNLVFQNPFKHSDCLQWLSKKRSVIQTVFLTTPYTSRNVFMKSGITVEITKMKGIWQEFKVRLLIWIFYGAYWLIKSIMMFRSSDIQTNESDNCHPTQSCG